MDTNLITAILVVAAILMFHAISIVDALKVSRAIQKKIAASWGKEPTGEYKQEELQLIASYFK